MRSRPDLFSSRIEEIVVERLIQGELGYEVTSDVMWAYYEEHQERIDKEVGKILKEAKAKVSRIERR